MIKRDERLMRLVESILDTCGTQGGMILGGLALIILSPLAILLSIGTGAFIVFIAIRHSINDAIDDAMATSMPAAGTHLMAHQRGGVGKLRQVKK